MLFPGDIRPLALSMSRLGLQSLSVPDSCAKIRLMTGNRHVIRTTPCNPYNAMQPVQRHATRTTPCNPYNAMQPVQRHVTRATPCNPCNAMQPVQRHDTGTTPCNLRNAMPETIDAKTGWHCRSGRRYPRQAGRHSLDRSGIPPAANPSGTCKYLFLLIQRYRQIPFLIQNHDLDASPTENRLNRSLLGKARWSKFAENH